MILIFVLVFGSLCGCICTAIPLIFEAIADHLETGSHL